jgi:drug/metabolite transporter (DMT)-like permease
MPGPVLIFIAAVLWGLDGVLRRSLYVLPASTIVFYEHLIGAIIILPFLYVVWKKETLTRKEWQAIGLVALLSGALGTLFFTSALSMTHFISFSVVYLVQKLQPIFTIATAWLVLGERPNQKYAIWAGLALVAAYFVTFPNGVVNMGDGGAYIFAAGLAFLAAVAWGSSTAFSRYTLLNHSNTLITGLRFLITVPIALLLVFGLGAGASLTTITPFQLLTLLAIALSTGMVALWIYYRGLKTTRASVSTIVELAFPLTAVLIDFFLYGTTLAASQYLAAIVLLFAMYKVAILNQDVNTS